VTAFQKLPDLVKTVRDLRKKVEHLESMNRGDSEAMPDDRTTECGCIQTRRFFDSADARALRILSEYLEPLSHFRRERIRGHHRVLRSARVHESGGPLARYYEMPAPWAGCSPSGSEEMRNSSTASWYAPAAGPGINGAAIAGGGPANEGHGKIGRPEHWPALRAIAEPVHFAGTLLRIPLLLHAQLLVRLPAKSWWSSQAGSAADELDEILTLVQTRKLAKKIGILLYGTEILEEIVKPSRPWCATEPSPGRTWTVPVRRRPDTALAILRKAY